MGMSKKDLQKHKGAHESKVAKLQEEASHGNDRAKKKLLKEQKK